MTPLKLYPLSNMCGHPGFSPISKLVDRKLKVEIHKFVDIILNFTIEKVGDLQKVYSFLTRHLL